MQRMVLDPLMDPISMAAESFSVHGPGGVRRRRPFETRERTCRGVLAWRWTDATLMGSGRSRCHERGWQAVTIDLRGHGESTGRAKATIGWSASPAISRVLRNLPGQPALVGASLGGFAAMLLAGDSRALPAQWCWWTSCRIWTWPGRAGSTSWPNGWDRGSARWTRWLTSSPTTTASAAAFGSGWLGGNLRRRGDRCYWHWDPQFIGGIAAFLVRSTSTA